MHQPPSPTAHPLLQLVTPSSSSTAGCFLTAHRALSQPLLYPANIALTWLGRECVQLKTLHVQAIRHGQVTPRSTFLNSDCSPNLLPRPSNGRPLPNHEDRRQEFLVIPGQMGGSGEPASLVPSRDPMNTSTPMWKLLESTVPHLQTTHTTPLGAIQGVSDPDSFSSSSPLRAHSPSPETEDRSYPLSSLLQVSKFQISKSP